MSTLAKDLLSDPLAARKLREWSDTPNQPIDVRLEAPGQVPRVVRVSALKTISATHVQPERNRHPGRPVSHQQKWTAALVEQVIDHFQTGDNLEWWTAAGWLALSLLFGLAAR